MRSMTAIATTSGHSRLACFLPGPRRHVARLAGCSSFWPVLLGDIRHPVQSHSCPGRPALHALQPCCLALLTAVLSHFIFGAATVNS